MQLEFKLILLQCCILAALVGLIATDIYYIKHISVAIMGAAYVVSFGLVVNDTYSIVKKGVRICG